MAENRVEFAEDLGAPAFHKLGEVSTKLEDIAGDLCNFRRTVLAGADEKTVKKIEGQILDIIGEIYGERHGKKVIGVYKPQ